MNGGKGNTGGFQVIGRAPTIAMHQATGRPAEPGLVVISDRALDHAATDHAEDFEEAVATLKRGIDNPAYFGEVKRGGAGMTVAYYYLHLDAERAVVLPVSTDRNAYGNYEARSFYIASKRTIEARLKKKQIVAVKK